jgi:SLT domain-containing protein
MLKGMGQALIQQGAIMIAQYIAIGIARLFAGIGAPAGAGAAPTGFDGSSQGLLSVGTRATGGPVTANRPYMVGENGPELMVPRTSGTVLNSEETRSAMERYSNVNNDSTVNYSPSIQSTVIGGQEYVTVDQMNKAVTQGMQVAAKKGAQGGFVRTMTSLKNNRSNRKTIGL